MAVAVYEEEIKIRIIRIRIMLNLKALQILFSCVPLCFLLYEMKQRNIPNSHREGPTLTPCHAPAPYLTRPLHCIALHPSTRVVASNLESNPGWGMPSERRDWSKKICHSWVPLSLPKILLLCTSTNCVLHLIY